MASAPRPEHLAGPLNELRRDGRVGGALYLRHGLVLVDVHEHPAERSAAPLDVGAVHGRCALALLWAEVVVRTTGSESDPAGLLVYHRTSQPEPSGSLMSARRTNAELRPRRR